MLPEGNPVGDAFVKTLTNASHLGKILVSTKRAMSVPVRDNGLSQLTADARQVCQIIGRSRVDVDEDGATVAGRMIVAML